MLEDSENSEQEDKKKCILVPWYNAAQFKKTYQYLYSPELVKRKWALDQISIWEKRCHPSLPTAIEASFGLASSVFQDILWESKASLCQQIDIEQLYSSAITRFVNLIVGAHEDQNKGVPMTLLAKSLGIPQHIIDMRNEACHGYRPTLSCLRAAAEAAMKHLKESYWEIEASTKRNFVREIVDVSKIRNLICDYIKHQLHLIKIQENNSSLNDGRRALKLKRCLKNMEALIRENKWQFIRILCEDGLFVPLEEDMKYCVTEEELKLFQGEYDENEENVPIPEHERSTIPDVPEICEELWRPVILLLHSYNAVPIFLEELIRSLGNRTAFAQKYVVSWVITFLKIHSVNGCFEKTSLSKIFQRKRMVVNWRSLFFATACNPCKYSPIVFTLLFCHVNFRRNTIRTVLNMVAIYTGLEQDEGLVLPKDYTFHTVEELRRMKRKQMAEIEKKRGEVKENPFQLCEDDSTRLWPIGTIVNRDDEEEKEEIQLDEEMMETLFQTDEDVDELYIISNENDIEVEEYCKMYTDTPDTVKEQTFRDEMVEEISSIKHFLYRK